MTLSSWSLFMFHWSELGRWPIPESHFGGGMGGLLDHSGHLTAAAGSATPEARGCLGDAYLNKMGVLLGRKKRRMGAR